MKPQNVCIAIAMPLLLGACAGTPPLRSQTASLQEGLAVASAAARLSDGTDADSAAFDRAVPLSLDRAVQRAFAHNPEVHAALARLDAAQAERVQAALLDNPMFSAMALRPEGGGRFQLEYGLMQSLYELLTRSRRIAVADAEAQRREAEVLLDLLTLAQDNRAALVDAWFAEQIVQLERQRLAVADESQRLALREVQQGIAPASAALAQQMAFVERAQALRAAEAAQLASRARLAGRLGQSSAEGLLLPAELPVPILAALDAAEWRDWAARQRPEQRMAAAQLEQARAQAALETGVWRATQPIMELGGMRDPKGMAMLGAKLQISLPLFDRGQARRALAAARIVEAEQESEALRRRIALDVETALATLVLLRDGAAQAEQRLRQQQQLEALAQRLHDQGLGGRSALQAATHERLMAVAERLQAERMYWSALLELERVTGRRVFEQNLPR